MAETPAAKEQRRIPFRDKRVPASSGKPSGRLYSACNKGGTAGDYARPFLGRAFFVPTMDKDKIIVVNLSGRGDKDVAAIARYRGEDLHD